MSETVIHDDDNQTLRWNGVSVTLYNKLSGVTAVMEVDGSSILMGSRGRMEMLHIQGNVVVNCFEDERNWPDAENEEEE